jgi:hypothetical protein
MAKLSSEINSTLLLIKQTLLEIIDEATATEFGLLAYLKLEEKGTKLSPF